MSTCVETDDRVVRRRLANVVKALQESGPWWELKAAEKELLLFLREREMILPYDVRPVSLGLED